MCLAHTDCREGEANLKYAGRGGRRKPTWKYANEERGVMRQADDQKCVKTYSTTLTSKPERHEKGVPRESCSNLSGARGWTWLQRQHKGGGSLSSHQNRKHRNERKPTVAALFSWLLLPPRFRKSYRLFCVYLFISLNLQWYLRSSPVEATNNISNVVTSRDRAYEQQTLTIA